VTPGENGLVVSGVAIERIGSLCFEHGIPLYELSPQEASLEEAYMELTGASVEYGAGHKAGV
jgi:ABC-2 type transport system ATP-binding protein